MKATFLFLATVLAVGGGFTDAQARGQNVSLVPAAVALLPDDHSGETHVVLRFDLSSLPNGEARVFTRANLEWTVAGLTAESECNIYAFPITGSWTAQGAASGQEPVAAEETDAAVWAVEPPDFAKRGGYVKLDLVDVVRDWADQTRANYGVLISFSDIGRGDLGEVLASARLNLRLGVDQ